ncbi:hypothetical protein CCP3SC5AM1_1520005 [Gammaproteobacteria bacterium]
MKVYIYTLKDPETNEIRYVGKSNENRIEKRLIEHCQEKRLNHNRHKDNWIRCLLRKKLKPVLEVIEESNTDNWSDREKYWITYYKKIGCSLTNTNEGGEGQPYRKSTQEHKEAVKKQISNTLKEYFSNKENRSICRKGGVASRGKKRPPRSHSGKASSSFVGVRKNGKKWISYININHKQLGLGSYRLEEEAAEAYDKAAIYLFGQGTTINFPVKLQKYLTTDIAAWFKTIFDNRVNKKYSSKYKYVSQVKDSRSLKEKIVWIAKDVADNYLGRFDSELAAANKVSVITGIPLFELEQLKIKR